MAGCFQWERFSSFRKAPSFASPSGLCLSSSYPLGLHIARGIEKRFSPVSPRRGDIPHTPQIWRRCINRNQIFLDPVEEILLAEKIITFISEISSSQTSRGHRDWWGNSDWIASRFITGTMVQLDWRDGQAGLRLTEMWGQWECSAVCVVSSQCDEC